MAKVKGMTKQETQFLNKGDKVSIHHSTIPMHIVIDVDTACGIVRTRPAGDMCTRYVNSCEDVTLIDEKCSVGNLAVADIADDHGMKLDDDGFTVIAVDEAGQEQEMSLQEFADICYERGFRDGMSAK